MNKDQTIQATRLMGEWVGGTPIQYRAKPEFIQTFRPGDYTAVPQPNPQDWTTLNPHNHLWDWSRCDYRIKPVVQTRWLNIYPGDGGAYVCECRAYVYECRADADRYARKNRIACIQITYTEGDGL
jgi:hypothetical protein